MLRLDMLYDVAFILAGVLANIAGPVPLQFPQLCGYILIPRNRFYNSTYLFKKIHEVRYILMNLGLCTVYSVHICIGNNMQKERNKKYYLGGGHDLSIRLFFQLMISTLVRSKGVSRRELKSAQTARVGRSIFNLDMSSFNMINHMFLGSAFKSTIYTHPD